MKTSDILSKLDHTLLKPNASWEDYQKLLDEHMKYKTASACLPPDLVARAVAYCQINGRICTVVGFPNGYNTREVKIYEARQALEDGVVEIDMVINNIDVKNLDYKKILEEIKAVRKLSSETILKVIVETDYLNKAEKKKLCLLVQEAGADYIKTSTGFAGSGASLEDVSLFLETAPDLKVKASGGISSLEEALAFLEAGADRLGASSLVRAIEEEEGNERL